MVTDAWEPIDFLAEFRERDTCLREVTQLLKEKAESETGKLGHKQAQAPTTAKWRSRATHAGLRQEPASCSYPASSNTSSSVP
jgi:hypothetical protein